MAEPTTQMPLAPRLTSAEAEALAAQAGLLEMGVRPPLGRYVRAVWGRRSFIWNLSASRAYARNQGSYLGQAWTVLKPILDAAVLVVIFGYVMPSAGGNLGNRPAFIVIGTFTYGLFQSGIMSGITSVPANLALIRSHQFPRAVVPLSTAMTETVLFVPIMAAMMILVMFAGQLPGADAIWPVWSWLLLPFAAGLLAVFTTGVAMIFARLGARTPDLANVVPFLLSLGRFATGVMFFLPAMIHESRWFRPIFLHQPVQVFLELFRAVFGNEPVLIPMTASLWLEAAAWAAGMFTLGFLFFWGAEETYGRD